MNDTTEIDDLHDVPLGIRSVLVGSLPTNLLASSAPDSYTVEAVFTRRVKPAEIEALHKVDTNDRLSDSGYPNVRLTVSDRRLQIQQTTLEELRDGLAPVIATLLADISLQVHRSERLATLAAELNDERELWRAKTVLSIAESIDFSLPVGFTREPLLPDDHGTDASQIAEWVGEGGTTPR